MIGLAQTRTPEAVRAEVERTPMLSAPIQGAPGVRTQVDPLTNWASPLYFQPGPARAMRAESTGTQDSSESTTLGQPAVFVAVAPCRLVDTRAGAGFSGAFGPPSIAANTPRTIPVPASPCGVPAAVAYSINIFAVPAAGALVGYVRAWPDDQPQPSATVLTDTIPGAILGSAAIVPAGADGGIDVVTQLATDLVIDINGYFVMPSTLALGAGTAAAPALTFGTDPTTGLFSTGPGTLSISTGGVTALTVNSSGNLDLAGSITKGGTLFLNNLGASEFPGLPSTSTALGLNALAQNAGYDNTAAGFYALSANTTGVMNTATGEAALNWNTTGNYNTATGAGALYANTSGCANTAAGEGALAFNTTGSENTSTGYEALAFNATGGNNTAMGWGALYANTSGSNNTAIGWETLLAGTIATGNTAVGSAALSSKLFTGSYNTALGQNAGLTATTGSHNIFIANQGTGNIDPFVADTESGTIRIGDSNQSRTFIAGIRGTTTGQANAIPVVIDSNGQLGTVSSSQLVKRDITNMGDTTETLMSLRPVQFRYDAYGPDSPLQYGLIAEEVAAVAPDLVARKANGEVETVFYDKVNAMLLNLVQKQEHTIEELRNQNEMLAETIRKVEARLAALEGPGSK
jgi:hypothetical protein